MFNGVSFGETHTYVNTSVRVDRRLRLHACTIWHFLDFLLFGFHWLAGFLCVAWLIFQFSPIFYLLC